MERRLVDAATRRRTTRRRTTRRLINTSGNWSTEFTHISTSLFTVDESPKVVISRPVASGGNWSTIDYNIVDQLSHGVNWSTVI